MMVRKMRRKISLVVILALLFGLQCEIHTFAEEAGAELLVVIDGSDSMSEEGNDVRKLLRILYQWLEEEAQFQNVQYIIFTDKAVKADYEDVVSFKPDGYTCISEGLAMADGIVKEAVNKGRKINVLVVSDMLASVRKGYTWEAALEEQETVQEFFGGWDQYCKKGEMSYLVLTWKDRECQSLSQIQEEFGTTEKPILKGNIKEFCCTVPERTCWIQQSEEDTQDSVLSQTQLVGNIIKNVLESLNGVQMENPRYVFASLDKDLELPAFCEAYVVTAGDNRLYLIENDVKKEMLTYQEIDDIRIYHLDMDFEKSTYRMSSETRDFECYLFYVPKPQAITTCSVLHPKAGVEFELKCMLKEESLCELLPKPLKVVICREEDGVMKDVCEAEMKEEKEGTFKVSMCLEESSYLFQIKTNNGQVLDEIEKKVSGGRRSTSSLTPMLKFVLKSMRTMLFEAKERILDCVA